MLHDVITALRGTDSPIAGAGYELGVGRTVPTIAAVVGLAAVVVGVLALARPGARGRPVAALVLGLVAALVGGLHAMNAAGGLGTGNGLAGALVAVVLGLIGAALGGLARTRSRSSV
ncbi:DUF6223 family protein [Actinomycetospora straminea]|uniref:Uncharacterized protein n=1 Tax=Actinomycetospora straminea TaxID=663607 RepID=A0ABP9EAM8_9PSEU|nr:DUF6223 family protein [Actinomycetospora straminea]MDD7932765.1 DUF6223 family protein [Actinomycetospora straminea]